MASSSSSTSLLSSSSSSSSSSKVVVEPETVGKAVDTLLEWNKCRSSNVEFFYLMLYLRKNQKIPQPPPKGRPRTIICHVPLPHSLRRSIDAASEEEKNCLVIDDHRSSSDSVKKKIKAEAIPISKVFKFSKLKADYRTYEATEKRKLCDSFDMFLADRGVSPLLAKCLGYRFFKKKKIPVPVDLALEENWKEQIERAYSSAHLYLRAATNGTCFEIVKVGRVSQTRGEVVENVVAAVEGADEIARKDGYNVRSLRLTMSMPDVESLSLLIYRAAGIDGEPASASKKRKKAGCVPDDSNEKQLDKKPLKKVKKVANKADAEMHEDGSSLAEELRKILTVK